MENWRFQTLIFIRRKYYNVICKVNKCKKKKKLLCYFLLFKNIYILIFLFTKRNYNNLLKSLKKNYVQSQIKLLLGKSFKKCPLRF